MFLPSCRKLPAKHFHHIDETEPFSVFVNGTVLQFLYQMELWLWWHREGFHLSPSWLVTKRTKWFFFFIWAVIDFMTINISWFLLNIKQHPSPISRKPQTVLNGWMAWIVCIVLFSYHKCACPMSRAIAATFWPHGRRALRARRPRGPNVKKCEVFKFDAAHKKCTCLTYVSASMIFCKKKKHFVTFTNGDTLKFR